MRDRSGRGKPRPYTAGTRMVSADNPLTQGLPFQKLHGNEGLALVLTDIVNRANVGMIEGRGRLRFALETFESLAVLGQCLGQELERHKPVQPGVFRLVDHTHTAAA